MAGSSSTERRAKNEAIFRERNEKIKLLAKRVMDKDSLLDLALRFTCECANPDCLEQIEIPVKEFESIRDNSRQFIVKPGHQQPDIEKVKKYKGYVVVEKFKEPPPA